MVVSSPQDCVTDSKALFFSNTRRSSTPTTLVVAYTLESKHKTLEVAYTMERKKRSNYQLIRKTH